MYNDYPINAPPRKWKLRLEEHKFGAITHATIFLVVVDALCIIPWGRHSAHIFSLLWLG